MKIPLSRRLAAELLGTAFLVAAVVGAGLAVRNARHARAAAEPQTEGGGKRGFGHPCVR